MAEAQHAAAVVVNGHHQHGVRNVKSDLQLSKTNELCAPSHSRSNSSDSGEGLVLSATDLQARSAYPAVAKLNNNCSQKADFNCCENKAVPLGGMGQTGNSTKPCLEHQKGILILNRLYC